MKFSLKSWLIFVSVFGTVLGTLIRLRIENPEAFVAVLRIGSTVGPFVLAIATVIWIGVRGASRGRGLIAWGVTLLLAPFLVQLGLMFLLPSGHPVQMLSTRRLIANRLPEQADAPWVWQELDRRLKNKDLTKEEVNEAIDEFAAYMKRTKPGGWNEPFSWQRDFLQTANQSGMISADTFLALCEAFYGPAPTVQLTLPQIDTTADSFQFRVEYGNPWSDHSGLDVELLWSVKQVLLDGEPLTVRSYDKHFNRQADVTVEGNTAPGEHTVAVELECAIVDKARLTGVDVDRLPVDQWPRARKRWEITQSVPLKVMPASE